MDQASFIHEDHPPNCFYRGAEAIDWMLRYPWMLEKCRSTLVEKRYHFSEIKDKFRYKLTHLSSSNNANGKSFFVTSYSTKDGFSTLKLLDFHVLHDGHDYATYLLLKYALRYHATRIEIPYYLISELRKYRFLGPFIQKKSRSTFYYVKDQKSPHNILKKDIILNYCDGDIPFS